MSRHGGYKDVSLKLEDEWHHSVPMNSTSEPNLSGRHRFELHESGAVEVYLTVYKPVAFSQTLNEEQGTVNRIHGPSSYVSVEGYDRRAAAKPDWRK